MSSPQVTWDEPAHGSAQQVEWDDEQKPENKPGVFDRVVAAYHHPGQAILGAAKSLPGLIRSGLPQSDTMQDKLLPVAEKKPSAIADVYNRAARTVDSSLTPKGDAQEGGADIAAAAGFARPAYEIGKAIPYDRLLKTGVGAAKGAIEHVPIVGPITKGAIKGGAEAWKASASAAPEGAEALRSIPIRQPAETPGIPLDKVDAKKKLEDLLLDSMGGKKLDPAIPLREQMPAKDVPEGHTPVESSAVRSFKYDPSTKEFHAQAASGNTVYVYGDVSPEEAQAFQNAGSKGKAWQVIRRNPLVAKVVNGKRVAVKPGTTPQD